MAKPRSKRLLGSFTPWQNRHAYNPQQPIALITSLVLQNQQNNMSSCCFPLNKTRFTDRQRAKLWNFLMISSKLVNLVKACSNVLAQRICMLIISWGVGNLCFFCVQCHFLKTWTITKLAGKLNDHGNIESCPLIFQGGWIPSTGWSIYTWIAWALIHRGNINLWLDQ